MNHVIYCHIRELRSVNIDLRAQSNEGKNITLVLPTFNKVKRILHFNPGLKAKILVSDTPYIWYHNKYLDKVLLYDVGTNNSMMGYCVPPLGWLVPCIRGRKTCTNYVNL